jgi:hypothetical protein
MSSKYDYNGFASELERYLRRYESRLKKQGFAFHSKLVGPGMGAGIMFVNTKIMLQIWNDRGQFFISVTDPQKRKKEIEMLILISLIRLANNPSLDRKEAFLLGGDLRDPLPLFFENIEAISDAIAVPNYPRTSRRVAALLRERSRLIFPPARKSPRARAAN